MLIGNLRISGLKVFVLRLTTRLTAICVGSGTEHFKLCQQPQIVGGRRHGTGRIRATSGVIRILGDGLHYGPQIGRQRSQKRVCCRIGRVTGSAQNSRSHLGLSPTTAVCIAGIHRERTRSRGIARRVIVAIHESHKLTADLAQQEVDAVDALLAGIVVETDDKGINFQVGDRSCAHLAIKSDSLGVAYGPVVGALICIRHLLDDLPLVFVEHRIHIVQRQSIVLILRSVDCLRGAVITLGGGDRPASKRGRVEGDGAGLIGASDGGSQRGVAARGSDGAADGCRQHQTAEMHGRRVGSSVFGDRYSGCVTLRVVLVGAHGVGAGALELDLCCTGVVCRGGVCLAGGQGGCDGRPGCGSDGQSCRKVRQGQRVLAAHGLHVDGVIRGQTGQLGRDRPKAHTGQSHGVAAAAVCRAGDGALAVGQGQGAASRSGDSQLGQRVPQHSVQRVLKVCRASACCILKGDIFRRQAVFEVVHLAYHLFDGGLHAVGFQTGGRAVKRDILGGDSSKKLLVCLRVFVVLGKQLSDPRFCSNGRRVCRHGDLRRAGDDDHAVKFEQQITHRGFRDNLEAVVVLKDADQSVAAAVIQLGVDANLMQGIALFQPLVADLDFEPIDRVVSLFVHCAVCKDKRLALVGHCRGFGQVVGGHGASAANCPSKRHALTGHSLGQHSHTKLCVCGCVPTHF